MDTSLLKRGLHSALVAAGLVVATGSLALAAPPAAAPGAKPKEALSDDTPKMGLQFGLNFSDASTTPDLATDTRTGLIVGGNLEFHITEILFLQPEVNYVQKGASNTSFGTETTVKYDYMTFPLLAKAKFDAGKTKPYFIAGPNLGIKVNSEVETIRGSRSSRFTTDAETVDFAFDFGGGVEHWFSSKYALFLSVRYSYGFTNVVRNSPISAWHNTGVQLFGGVEFDL